MSYMFFKKKKRMIDLRELQRRGVVVRAPQNRNIVPTDSDGFVELGSGDSGSSVANSIVSGSDSSSTSSGSTGSSSSSFFGFMGDSDSSGTGASSSLSSDTTPSEDLRKISAQLGDLDNKIYKIEQRIELLERKAGVGDSSSSSVGTAGW
jgi:hypothetical protein